LLLLLESMMRGSSAGCKAASEIAAMTNEAFSSEVDTGSRNETRQTSDADLRL
jgi:hypothetical protein